MHGESSPTYMYVSCALRHCLSYPRGHWCRAWCSQGLSYQEAVSVYDKFIMIESALMRERGCGYKDETHLRLLVDARLRMRKKAMKETPYDSQRKTLH